MLLQLPIEISYKILRSLSTFDLVRCSETCRDWNIFIRTKVTIQELEPKRTNQFNSVMAAVKKGYIDGSRITCLITEYRCTRYSVETIPRLFPAIKTFKSGSKLCFSDDDHVPIMRKIIAFKKWQKTLETLSVTGASNEIRLLLKKCRFERLTDLNIYFVDYRSVDLEEGMIMSHLKYVPQLRSLSLRRETVTFKHLACIHHSLPLLEKLYLNYAPIFRDTNSSVNIPVLKTLTHLSLNFMVQDIPNTFSVLFRCITEKYPSLTHLEITIEDDFRDLLPNPEATENELLELYRGLPASLKSFKNKLGFTTKPLLEVLNQAIHLGKLPVLAELFLCFPKDACTDFIAWFYRSSKHLILSLESLSLEAEDIIKLYESIPFTTNIKKLEVTGELRSFSVMYLDRILDMNPLLEELSIQTFCTRICIQNFGGERKNRIRKLTLNTGLISRVALLYINNSMPHLKQLSIRSMEHMVKAFARVQAILNNSELDNNDDDNDDFLFTHPIYLPHLRLETLDLFALAKTGFRLNDILCTVKDSIGKRHYFYDATKHKVKYFNTDLSMEDNEIMDYTALYIECKNLQCLTVNDVNIF